MVQLLERISLNANNFRKVEYVIWKKHPWLNMVDWEHQLDLLKRSKFCDHLQVLLWLKLTHVQRVYQNVKFTYFLVLHSTSYKLKLFLQSLGVLNDSCAMFDVIDDPAKNAFQISSAVVSIHNNWLQATLDYMFVPVLVEKLTLATHTE